MSSFENETEIPLNLRTMIIKVPIYVEVSKIPVGSASSLVNMLSIKLTSEIQRTSIGNYFTGTKAKQELFDTFGELKAIQKEKALEYLRTSK